MFAIFIVVSSPLILWPIGSCEWHCIFLLPSFLIPWPAAWDGEWYCHSPLPGILIMFHPMTNRGWVTCIFFLPDTLIISHPMTNRMWVTLHPIFSFARQSHHLSSMINSQWVCCILFSCQAVSSCFIPWPRTASECHVTFFFCQAISSHFIPWPTEGKSQVALHFWLGSHSLIISHPMANSL